MNRLANILVAILIVLSITTVVSATPVDVYTVVPNTVYAGDAFDIIIHVNPNGNEMSGMQFNINYDYNAVIINSVTESNLFKQDGAYETFFVDGSCECGATTDIYSAILGPNSVSTSGDFVVISVTPIKPGEILLELTNIIAASPESIPVEYTLHETSLITVIEYPPYDLNRDGTVDILDITMVAQWFGFAIP